MTYTVYLIKSLKFENKHYIGITQDIDKRLAQHNAGESQYTSKFKPWELVTHVTFADKDKAYGFEKYLKSHSGRAFANKRLW